MTEQKRPQQCEGCALAEHDAYICARWRLSYAVNELKKAIPLVRRTAAENRCMAGLWRAEEYDTPSPLAEFGLNRPPMSWKYVEVPDLEDE